MKKSLYAAYLELTKPRVLTLVLVTTTIGYYLGGRGFQNILLYLNLIIGVALACGGSSALNHYLEREYDSKMTRTQHRPIPSGVISPSHALTFGTVLTLFGVAWLYIQVNLLTSFLILLAAFLYIMVYTPMKRVSWLNTTVGAFPGAIPPLGGWAAATGTLNFDAGILFLILFLWQHPHFYAIAWMLKEDYEKVGFKMLPCVKEGPRRTLLQIQWFSAALVCASIIPAFTGMSGRLYCIGALLSGLFLFLIAYHFTRSKTHQDARTLLKATVYYLPILFIVIVLDGALRFH